MITVAKCKKGTFVQLPENAECKAGDSIPCPNSCNYKLGMCANPQSFSVVSVYKIDENKAVGVKKYSAEEIGLHWGQAAAAPSGKRDMQRSQSEADLSFNSSLAENNDGSPEVAGHTAATDNGNASRPKTFGRSFRTQSGAAASDNAAQADEIIKPQASYESFVISGKVFTDDTAIKAVTSTYPLKNALWEIFSFWETRSVFKTATQLNDEFIWLMTSLSSRSFKKSEIDSILLNQEYGVSEKFFYLFYDVIYRYERPQGFYWCDDVLSCYPLTAYFKDKNDFMVRYCNPTSQGEQFRAFYVKHKREVLHFLGIEDEEKLFNDMTLSLAKDEGKIVLIDKYNNYKPVNMGSIGEFIKKMQQPSDLTDMNNMVYFLEKYRVTRLGVVPRSVEYNFEKSVRGKEVKEDQSMYATLNLGSSSSASEYDCFVTLLREYMQAFNPDKITIGDLTFTKSNYSNELKEIIKNFCKAFFGEVSDDVLNENKSRAWLAKSIYDRNILSTFVLENRAYIDKLMQIMLNPTLEQYLATFDDCVIQLHYRDLTIHEYIEELMQDEVYTVCGRFREDDVVRAFFNSRIKNWDKADLSELYDKYQQQFNAFMQS